MFAQHLPAGWATLVWRCLVQEAGVLRLTRKDPDHLPATAAQNSIIPGRGLLALRHRVALLWDREGPFLLHSSGQRGVASPINTGASSAASRSSSSRSAPERSAWPELVHSTSEPSRRVPPVVPRRRRAPPFPSLAVNPPPRHSRTPGSACPVTAPPLHHVRVDANAFQRQLLPHHPSLALRAA